MGHDNFVTQSSPSTASSNQGEKPHDHIPQGLRGQELLVHDLQRCRERDEVSACASGGAFKSADVGAARFSPEGKIYRLLTGAKGFFAPICSSAAAYCGD